MVSKARNVGDALKKFATGFIEIFSGKSDDTKPPTGGDPPKTPAAQPEGNAPKPAAAAQPEGNAPKPAAKPEGGGGGKKDTSFAVQAITAGQEGVEGHIAAEQDLIEDNKKIAKLYRELAESIQSLAIAKAIGSQMTGYSRALRETATKSAKYLKTWDSLISGLDSLKN